MDAVVGLAWVANWYAVKAWASRTMRLTRVTNAAQARGCAGSCLIEGCCLSRDHLPSCSCPFGLGRAVAREACGGERCRPCRRPCGCRDSSRSARTPRRSGCHGRRAPAPRDVASGLAGGRLAGHCWAMIASNSARSSSSSAHTNSRNSSSRLRASPTGSPGIVGMRITACGQALIACRPWFLLPISILRGLACSATGICSVRTPPS